MQSQKARLGARLGLGVAPPLRFWNPCHIAIQRRVGDAFRLRQEPSRRGLLRPIRVRHVPSPPAVSKGLKGPVTAFLEPCTARAATADRATTVISQVCAELHGRVLESNS